MTNEKHGDTIYWIMCIRMKKRKISRMLAGILAAFLIMGTAGTEAFAYAEWPSECYVLSEGACLIDADSGVVLFDQNAHEAYYPASITKVLTALVVLENCDNLSEMVTFSYDAVHIEEQNSTIIGASEGDRLSVLDCLYCLLFQSANEVANALAEHVGAKHPELKEKGETDLQVFVKLMNERAKEAGALGSHFNNPSGLTDENHYTTPYDMCMILMDAIRNKTFRDIESHTYWTHAPIARYPDADDPWNTVYMKHMMLRKNSDQYYKGCIAGKTGYTVTAGNTLVTACERDGMTLCCCVMNAHANHYNDTTRLFDFGFEHFMSVKVGELDRHEELIQKDFMMAGIPVLDSYTLGLPEGVGITLPIDAEVRDVTAELSTEEDSAGTILYTYGDRTVGTAELTLKSLGGMKDMVNSAEDPLFYKIAGIDPPEETVTAEETAEPKTSGTGEEASVTETEPSSERAEIPEENPVGSIFRKENLKKALYVLLAVVIAAAAAFFIRLRKEQKEAIRRQQHRRERMQKTADLSGSQRIKMDLMVQEKSKKNGSRRRR